VKRFFRSPSLFLTFAGAFLGVLIVGTILQGFVVVRLVGSIRERLDRSNAEALVQVVAQEVAVEVANAEAPNVAKVLDRHPSRPDSLLLVYRRSDGSVVLATSVRARRRRLAFAIRRLLSGEPLLPPGRLAQPPADRPLRSDSRPGGRPPRGSRLPPGFEPGDAPPRGAAFARPRVMATTAVNVAGETVGQVIALRWGPPPGALPSLARDSRGFLLFLPLAILLAGAAGLLVFRSLLARLRKLEALTARVAEGDLNVRIPDPGVDEIGRLGTSLNRMTQRLAVAKRDVDETHRQRRQLFADISHELATPMTSIHGYTETLLNRDVTVSADERETYLRHILDASTRMGLLIDDLLELTRLESGTIQLGKERINWTKLCLNTQQRFEPRFRAAGLQIGWSGPQDDAWIFADGRRMEQVIDNLLVNALRYVPAGGHVSVSLAVAAAFGSTRAGGPSADDSERPRHRLVVADDGPGFPPQDVGHVFDRFFRGRAGSVADGSGLGLAIVKEIVRSHGGDVTARNGDPSGAIIEVELPAHRG
jgi:signal transduction histidine kinase